jgi:hypothetical protein
MSLPSILLSLVVASLLGAFYHLWRGGGPVRIVFYLLMAWIGFFSGTYLAHLKGWVFAVIGQVDVGFGVLGALVILGLGDWLTLNIREA